MGFKFTSYNLIIGRFSGTTKKEEKHDFNAKLRLSKNSILFPYLLLSAVTVDNKKNQSREQNLCTLYNLWSKHENFLT